jgi:PAS domain S-box-containing protein
MDVHMLPRQLEATPRPDLRHLTDALERLQRAEQQFHLQHEQLLRTEQVLLDEQRHYRELFELAPDGYLTTDCAGRIQEANRAATTIFQIRKQELVGKPLAVLIGSEDRMAFHEEMSRIRLQADLERIAGWELSIRRPDAPPLTVSLTVGIVRDSQQRPEFLRWIIRDVSARKRIEQALIAERDFAEGLIESAQAAVLLLDPMGRIVRSNQYLSDLTGYTADELRGSDWLSLLIPYTDRAAVTAWFSALLAGGTKEFVGPIQTKAGGLFPLKRTGKVLAQLGVGPTGVLIVGLDMTNFEKAQERALQAERLAAIGQMVTGLAHESRNALQRSQACLEMLAKEVSDRPRALNLLERLQTAQDHLHHLYEEVRQFAAPIALERRSCNLAAVWREAWARLELQHQGRKVTLREQVNGTDMFCLADPFRLEQVFRNILDNALAACQDPVDIVIRCAAVASADRPTVQVAVTDNGPGLSPEQRQRVFEPFFTTKVRGTGLGLAIAKRIVEAHGGRITVTAKATPGAEVVVALPKGEP